MPAELSPELISELSAVAAAIQNAPENHREEIARLQLPVVASVMEIMSALGRSGDTFDKQFCIGARVAFQPLGDAIRMEKPIARHVASAARDLASQLRRHPECQTPAPAVTHFTPPVDAPALLPFSFPQNTYTGSIA